MREIRPGVWQRVRIESEYDSRNFLKHGHRLDGCDVIVCWRNKWKGSSRNLEVVELRRWEAYTCAFFQTRPARLL